MSNSDGISNDGKMIGQAFFKGLPENLRYSTALVALKRLGQDTSTFESDKKAFGSYCQKHGELLDPIIALLPNRVAFACPWCSSPDVLAAWEKEGMRS